MKLRGCCGKHRTVILIFGIRPTESVLVVVDFVCNYCHTAASQTVYKQMNRLSLFFIPVFSVLTKYFVECSNCGGVTPLTREQAHHSLEWAARTRDAA